MASSSPLTAITMTPAEPNNDEFGDSNLSAMMKENMTELEDAPDANSLMSNVSKTLPTVASTTTASTRPSSPRKVPPVSKSSGISPALIRNSKRSSSTSNDLLYERDRFRARLHNFNISSNEEEFKNQQEGCDVCDVIGSKTTKLNVVKDELEPELATEMSEIEPNNEPELGHGVDNLESGSEIGHIGAIPEDSLSPLDFRSTYFQHLPIMDHYKLHDTMTIKSINLQDLEFIFNWYFNKPLPPTHSMFPWLHGLNADNFAQRQFFLQQQREQQQASDITIDDIDCKPDARFLMTVNADIMENNEPILKNSTLINEILCPIDISREEVHDLLKNIVLKVFPNEGPIDTILETLLKDIFRLNYLPLFLNLDPDRGVSLRNFHIQVTKLAICSDFIVYCFNKENQDFSDSIARVLWLAQRFEEVSNNVNDTKPKYNVFVLHHYDPVRNSDHPRLFSVNLKTKVSGKNLDINKVVKLQLKYLQCWDSEYSVKEKVETIKMSSASKLNGQLFSGNSWDYQNFLNFKYSKKKDYLSCKKPLSIRNLFCTPLNSITTSNFNIHDTIETILPLPNLNYKLFVNCFNEANFPDLSSLENMLSLFNAYKKGDDLGDFYYLTFPSSGAIGIGDVKKDNIASILNLCKLLYLISNVRGIDCLIYCSDGYTELSLLNLCYIIYSLDCLLNDAIINLHLNYGRPFYIFNTDVQILQKLEPILRKYSPVSSASAAASIDWGSCEELTNHEINQMLLSSPKSHAGGFKLSSSYSAFDNNDSSSSSDSGSESSSSMEDPMYENRTDWCKEVDGSLPSRILPYLYLGSLKHANCLALLKELGISKVISVGEPLLWIHSARFERQNDIVIDELNDGDIQVYNIFPKDPARSDLSVNQVVKVNNLQDDGIDQLECSLPAILQYIDDEYKRSHGQSKILIHCRVGVSRSATVVIAEVMKRLKINLPKAYLYVRVRRLNIIIQPNLKFLYEIFKWEEQHKHEKNQYLREIDWFGLCREITLLNNPYLSSSLT